MYKYKVVENGQTITHHVSANPNLHYWVYAQLPQLETPEYIYYSSITDWKLCLGSPDRVIYNSGYLILV